MTRERVINMIDCILGNDILCDCIEDSTIGCNECRREAADIAINALKGQKSGKWKKKIIPSTLGYYEYECSECGHTWQYREILNWKFCPNCGKPME